MNMKILSALLWVLVFSLPAYADSPTGQEINSMMLRSEARTAPSGAEGSDFQAGAYEGYIMGVSDGLMGTSLYYYCAPPKADRAQLRTVVTKYLKTHQRDLHVPAGALVTAALIEAFPCKKKPHDND